MKMKKIRVVALISNLEYGGAQRQVAELFNHIDSNRYEMHICSLSDYIPLAEELNNKNGRLHVVKKENKYDLSVVWRLAKLLRDIDAQIVISYLFDADIAARLAGKIVGIKVVNSERNSNYHLKFIKTVTYYLTRKLVDLWIANSRAGAVFSQKALKHRRDKYRVIYNGVNTDLFRPQERDMARDKIGIDPETKVVGMFASFKDQKNQPMLLKAFKKALKKMDNLKLLLVGDELFKGMHGSDTYAAHVKNLITELDLSEHCVLLGNCKNVFDLYPVCDCTVLTSKFEGTPNVLLESMACGIPVIATKVSDNVHIVKDQHVGYLVELNDIDDLSGRIVEILSNDKKRLKMGKQARLWAEEKFSSHVLARNTESVIDQVLSC